MSFKFLKSLGFLSCVLAATSNIPSQAETFDLSTATLADIIEATDAGALSSEKLVQLYLTQDKIDGAVVRLESIIKDYERTKTSAEAYYLLGQINLSYFWKPDLAKEKFIQVKKIID